MDERCGCGWRGSHEQALGFGNHYASCPEDGDPLTDPIPEDQTRLGDTALTLHELARAEHRAQRGTVYWHETLARRIIRTLGRRIR